MSARKSRTSKGPRQFTHLGKTWVCTETDGVWSAICEGHSVTAGDWKGLRERIKAEGELANLSPEERKAKEKQFFFKQIEQQMKATLQRPVLEGKYRSDMFGNQDQPGLIPRVQTHEILLTYLCDMGNAVETEIKAAREEITKSGASEGAISVFNRLLDLIEWTVVSNDRTQAWVEQKRMQEADKEKARMQAAAAEGKIIDPGVSEGSRNEISGEEVTNIEPVNQAI